MNSFFAGSVHRVEKEEEPPLPVHLHQKVVNSELSKETDNKLEKARKVVAAKQKKLKRLESKVRYNPTTQMYNICPAR